MNPLQGSRGPDGDFSKFPEGDLTIRDLPLPENPSPPSHLLDQNPIAIHNLLLNNCQPFENGKGASQIHQIAQQIFLNAFDQRGQL